MAASRSPVKSAAAVRTALFGLALALCGATTAAAQEGLPGGASSLNETHGDWVVKCQQQNAATRCALSQSQVNQQSRQRVLAIELAPDDDGETASGVVILPFGLRLSSGAVLRIDEGAPLPALGFSTCLPAGCLVPLTFDAAMVAALRGGTALKLTAVANDGEQQVAFSISLTGFSSALARAAALDQ
ncbi:invasion associated locus B family protein [Mesorhizobium sp. Root157]|uniref:invasion associated locus B family protein n=1 Tax=Mesorhizobium sp. Root157 TaxID=1736477 RepID=UPI001FCE2C07|nr:invasion associated locus B family protein [Mesorhizobium sp. Root157]